ncbi:MAG: PAS domain S-box protein [Syntrophorhabdales bacterium]|jgi:PAS domain S-box-containing protein
MADRRSPTDPNAASPQHDNVLNPKEDFLFGGGETGELIRSIDWSKTPLGSRDAWPESLRTAVNLILASSFPMAILWGSDLIYIYNDAYRVIAASRHPSAMGKSIREVWPETWEFNKAVLERVMALGETVRFEDQLYRTARHGSMEDGYFTLSYSPIRSESGQVAGTLVVLMETTERKQTEEALRQQAEEFQHLLDMVPAAVWIARDPECLTITGNRRADQFYEASSGENVSATTLPDARRFFDRNGRELAASELPMQLCVATNQEVRDFELEVRLPSGRQMTMLGSAIPLRDAKSDVRGCIGTFIDITDRKRVEEALRIHRELLETIAYNLPVGTAVIRGNDLRILLANPAYLAIVPGREMVGKALEEAWPETHPGFSELCRQVLATRQPYNAEDELFTIRRSPNSPLETAYFSWSLFPVFLPGDEDWGLLSVCLETTERKRAEEALRERESRYRELVQNANSAIVRWKRDGTIAFINEYALAFFGYSVEEVLGKSVAILLPETESNGRDLSTLVDEIISRPENYVNNINENIRRDGSRVWMAWTNRPVFDENGQVSEIFAVGSDITERKQAEEALRQSRAKLDAALASMSDSIFIADAEGQFIHFNDAFVTYHRFRDREECSKKIEDCANYLDAYFADGTLAPPDMWAMPRALRGETASDVEYMLRRKDTGETWWGSYTFAPIRDKNGEIVGAVVAGREITDRKQMEGELRRSRDELELRVQERTEALRRQADLIELSHEAIIVRDLESRVLFWSRGAEEAYGFTKAEAEGNITHSLLKTRFPVPFDEHMAALTREGRWEGELIHTRKDGSELIVLSRQALQRDEAGTPIAIMEINIDITERKRAEIDLQASEERWATTLASIGDAVIATDMSGCIVFMNAVAEALTGWTRGDASQKPITEVFHIINEQTRLEVENPITRVLQEGVIVGLANHTLLVRQDGTEVPIDDSGAPIRDKEGKIRGVVLIFRDITERKQAEEKLTREMNERAKTEEQLRQAQKMEALGTMSGGIAHDFNNLLAAIIGFTELVADHAAKGSRDERHLARIMESSLRGRDLVRQMLTFSRRAEQEKKPLSLSSIVKESVKLVRATTPTTISIKVDTLSESGLILADPTQMQQVIVNLCTNAAHAMREKGGTLDVQVNNHNVSPSDGNPHGIKPGLYTRLTVRDTGIGMSADIMDKIFDPFFTTKKLGEGTGLGLSVVHGIVKQSSGHITVESEPGRGSTFTVYLPKVKGEVEADEVSDEEIPTGSERILFVDDEEALVEMGEDILAELGYEVASRMSSWEALALFKVDPSRFDVLITDQTMPEMTGVELAKEILALRADMPIIMCTGFSYTVNEMSAKAAGIKAFAMKPLTKREIARTIRKVLDE